MTVAYDRLQTSHRLEYLQQLMDNPVFTHLVSNAMDAHTQIAVQAADPAQRETSRQRVLALQALLGEAQALGEQLRVEVRSHDGT